MCSLLLTQLRAKGTAARTLGGHLTHRLLRARLGQKGYFLKDKCSFGPVFKGQPQFLFQRLKKENSLQAGATAAGATPGTASLPPALIPKLQWLRASREVPLLRLAKRGVLG